MQFSGARILFSQLRLCMIFWGEQKLLQKCFNIKKQDLESRKHLLDVFRWLPLHDFLFSSFCCVGILEIAQHPPPPHPAMFSTHYSKHTSPTSLALVNGKVCNKRLSKRKEFKDRDTILKWRLVVRTLIFLFEITLSL